mmetsp:Transcript_36318/g.43910  ORF Transcript_36318/g.43910 Transcript_36318/m.43910 type:complete len:582 (-) Transcript_36318:296-2041(-)|eukprot:CAMPEP_0197848740 /NCGR_PEP_ID=MMETSP1438-20131217/9865_1 /TAXON_ID=1461541 /ORGANISM="Pterosperma sp., Strain CCMP1384" /LENGTH=581 /DNA_ID=CAMNT_0043461133 /DNA_START=115 /DNA_END=1860 /DNA_ORIENTATION=+
MLGMSAKRLGALATAACSSAACAPQASCEKEKIPAHFDPEALERGVEALREITKSQFAKQVIELSKKQEETKVQEAKTKESEMLSYAKQAEIEREKVHWEEMRKTQQQQSQTKAQLAKYEDELARARAQTEHEANRQRNAEMVQMQEEANQRTEAHRRVVEEQIQETRRKGEEAKADIERETLRQKALAEAEGRIKEGRENEDVNRRQMIQRIEKETEKAVATINAVMGNLGTAATELLSDQTKVLTGVAGLSALAIGIYGSREGAKLGARLLEKYAGQPSLVRETSRRSWRNPFATTLAPAAAQAGGLGKGGAGAAVVLEPVLDSQVRSLAAQMGNWKKNNATFRNALFYGPPGTGKTLAASQLARYSGLDYAIMTGGDVAPLGGEAVTRLHEMFDWAQTSKKGMLLFIDEADSFLGARGREGTSEGVRSAMNALLARTGDQSKSIALVLATNRPTDLDAAITDRMDEIMEFTTPGLAEREKIFKAHLDVYLNPKSEGGMFGGAQTAEAKVEEGVEELMAEVAQRTEGFSGREMAKLAASVQGAVYGQSVPVLTKDLLHAVLDHKVKEHQYRQLLLGSQK